MSFFFSGNQLGSSIDSSEITDGAILNADVNASAGIVNSKLAPPHDSITYTDGGVLLGSGVGSISAMAVLANGEMIVGDGTTDPVAESGATLRTSIGVGIGSAVIFDTISLQGDSNQIVLDSDDGGGVTTTITDSATAARVITLPDATDTLVGKATTDTLTNKTFDANGTGNAISNIDVVDLANGTDGELITWAADATATTVAVGTSGQVLTSGGAGVAPTFQAASGGTVVQQVKADSNTYVDITATIPNDDTIPQSGEGTEILTAAITPTNSNNTLVIEFNVSGTAATNSKATLALFQDATVNALNATIVSDGAETWQTWSIQYTMAAGTTSSTTFKIRGGPSVDNFYINGSSGGRKLGGVMIASLIITEYEV